jgi:hypothetical protein
MVISFFIKETSASGVLGPTEKSNWWGKLSLVILYSSKNRKYIFHHQV